jgi:pSer/pThr/pTyr-binding forkhead associated (FHA) protein
LEETAAFVVIDGQRHVELARPLITVGRQLDNDIVLDAPSVSRHHAQLRWRYGRFVIYDLGSQQGTWVNGQMVTEHVLQAGDVIWLSTVAMIYGEDPLQGNGAGPAPGRPDDLGTTQSFGPSEGS